MQDTERDQGRVRPVWALRAVTGRRPREWAGQSLQLLCPQSGWRLNRLEPERPFTPCLPRQWKLWEEQTALSRLSVLDTQTVLVNGHQE